MVAVEHKVRLTSGQSRVDAAASASSCEALDKASVAELSARTIAGLTREELARVIRAAELPLLNRHDGDRLELLNRETLERLAHLARRCCRHQGY